MTVQEPAGYSYPMRAIAIALLGSLLFACRTAPSSAESLALAQEIQVKNARVPEDGLLCAGQLERARPWFDTLPPMATGGRSAG